MIKLIEGEFAVLGDTTIDPGFNPGIRDALGLVVDLNATEFGFDDAEGDRAVGDVLLGEDDAHQPALLPVVFGDGVGGAFEVVKGDGFADEISDDGL